MDAFAEVGRLVDGLCGLVQMHAGPTLAVGLAGPDGPPDVRIPPPGFATVAGDVPTKLIAALARGVQDDTTAVLCERFCPVVARQRFEPGESVVYTVGASGSTARRNPLTG